MVNTYGYNRKTLEEDERILAAVWRHHNAVAHKGYLVVMTSLVGSQNYDLDHENSDIDTFSLVYPPLQDLANAKEPYAGMFEAEDGHCEIKDIRLALNLLRKASPNSVEYFTSKYKIYNPLFEDILKEYLDDNTKLWNMVHCNYSHMLYSMAGMARQLLKRNMPAGKRFSHALRLDNMYYHFMNSANAGAILDLKMNGDRDLALMAKRDTEEAEEYMAMCENIANKLERYRAEFKLNEQQETIQQYGLALIDSFQWKLFKKYLMETNK
jgi:predicted nucleotidyltransferase